MLTFQLRILVLVMLVAATATAATAWLAYRLAAAQVAASQAATDEDARQITGALVLHAQRGGGWHDVAPTVARLEKATGQRIVLSTESGTSVADTDDDPGQAVGAQSIRVDPRPILNLQPEQLPVASAITHVEIDAYRSTSRLAACLAATGVSARLTVGATGIPHFAEATGAPAGAHHSDIGECHASAASTDAERNEDFAMVNRCAAVGAGQRIGCLRAAFTERTGTVGPQPLLARFGTGGGPGLTAGPIVGAAALVMVFAAVGSAVVSRRALRPITALTRAVRQLGEGDLRGRAPVRGNDQVAELTRSFNRMADSLQRGEERQRRMIADVAHELRTPLSNLRGHLEGLMDGIIPPGPELFASLHEEALLQQRVVDDLQDLALAEAGALTYRRCLVDVGELLEICRHAHHPPGGATGARLEVRVDRRIFVEADPDRLRQVVSNLVGNALRYTPAGGTVTLRCGTDGPVAVIQVRDTGCGIAEQDLPRVFDRFWRADGARGRSTGGSGLGLAIAYQIVTDHGGTICADSAPRQGSTFTLRLPLVDIAPSTDSAG